MQGLRTRRPSPSMIVALIALCLSMSGVGFAAAKLTGADVKNNTLTGRDIKESTLRKVPKAKRADSVDGQSIAKISFGGRIDGGRRTIFSAGALKITASCTSNLGLLLTASSASNGMVYGHFRPDGQPGQFFEGRGSLPEEFDLLLGQATPGNHAGDHGYVEFTARMTGGFVATGSIQTDVGAASSCVALGNVIYG